MEHLRKDAKRLAVWNLAVVLIFFIITSIYFVGPQPRLNYMNVRTILGWMCVLCLLLIPLRYYLWFRFFKGMKKAYPDNRNMEFAMNLGNAAYISLSAAFVISFVATIFGAYFINPDTFSFDFNANGILPHNEYGERCNILIQSAEFLIALMYYFLARLTKPKSFIRKLAVLLALKWPLLLVITLYISSTGLAIVHIAYWITEFLFLMQIAKGNEFRKLKEETAEA